MKADGSLKSLLQGVSQQPVRDRLPGQCSEQINMSADPVKGLTRRPGSDLVGSLGVDADVRGHGNIVLPDGREAVVKVLPTGIRVFDYNANEFTVNHTGDMDYFSTPGKWSITTMKDKTYLANEGVITAMRDQLPEYPNAGAAGFSAYGIIQVLGGAYAKRYSIYVDGVEVAGYKTEDGSEANEAEFVGTTYIAKSLEWLLENGPAEPVPSWLYGSDFVHTGIAAGGAYVAVRQDDIIRLRRSTPTRFSLITSDDAGGINMKSMTETVPDIADLPKYAPHNYVVRVAQETDPEEDLWLRFVSDVAGRTSGGGFGDPGAWYEALAPDIPMGFDKSTMPRVLTWDADTDEFTLSEGEWNDRTVGTEKTNPVPSFVGYGISDVSTFQSRLILLGGPNLGGSRSREYENFWVASASTLVDADPIDLTSQAAFASVLKYAVPHNKDLVIFSSRGQFVMFGRTAVTPSNAALVITTSFEADLTAEPVPCGRNVFFCTQYGRFTGVREFYTEGGTDINDTRPITQHVKNYLRGSPQHLSATSNYDTMLVHTDQNRETVYAYQFIWADNEKVQSAWSKWQWSLPCVYSWFDDELIYMIVRSGDEEILLRCSLDVTPEDGVGYHVHLDMKFDVPGVDTQFTLPLDFLASVGPLIVVQGEDAPNPGLNVVIEDVSFDVGENAYVVTLKSSMGGGSVVVGTTFKSDYWPTMPRYKDRDGVVVSNARLMITQFLVALEQTGHIFGQKVTPWDLGPAWEVPFEGYVVSGIGSVVGQYALSDEIFIMPFDDNADMGEVHFYTEKQFPMTMLDIEWEGTINKRGTRVGTGG